MMDVSTLPGSRLTPDHVQAWTQLMRADRALDHPLFHPRWVQVVGEVCPCVEVAAVRDGGDWIGFFPFERTGRGTARPVAAGMSDMHGLVARPEEEIPLAELFRRCGLSSFSFDHVPVEQRWFAPYTHRTEPAAIVDLEGGADRWWQRIEENHSAWAKQFQRKSRKLHREVGPLRFEWRSADPAALLALIQWKQWRLQRSGFRDVFQADWLRELLPLVCREQSLEFAGVLSAYYAGSQLLAVHLGLRSGTVLVSWIPAYHPDFAKYSVGAMLHVELARHAGVEGVTRIDLGRGINPLKQALSTGSVELAIGAVDLRAARRWLRSGYSHLRELVDAAPLGARMIRACRPVRNWLLPHS